VGNKLAKIWAFPEPLADAIKYHHCPEGNSSDSRLTHIVYLADLLISCFHGGLELGRVETAGLGMRLEKIGLSAAQFPGLVDLVPGHVLGDIPEMALDA